MASGGVAMSRGSAPVSLDLLGDKSMSSVRWRGCVKFRLNLLPLER